MAEITSNFELLSEEEITKYAGEWVAIVENKIVKHGKSFKKVYNSVKEEYPGKKPLFGKLPETIPLVYSID